jgi:hypothetical protein
MLLVRRPTMGPTLYIQEGQEGHLCKSPAGPVWHVDGLPPPVVQEVQKRLGGPPD